MPRNDDFDDDERPRRRPRDDEDDDRPVRSRRPRDGDEEDRPRRRRPRDEDDDEVVAPRRKKKGTGVGLILGILGAVLLLCCGGGGLIAYLLSDKIGLDAQDRKVSNNNLKQIGLGIHNYHDVNNAVPSNTYGPDGKPLLSWRVHILPYVEQDALFKQFKLDEPWDGPNNRRLISQMPRLYVTSDTRARAGEGKTFYRGFSHRGAVFEKPLAPGNRLSFARISDGLSNTIFVVEAGEAVDWTKPDELDFGPGRHLPPLGAGRASDKVLVLMGDGSTRYYSKSLPESTWRALISYNGNEIVPGP
jgi:hypothetical protein